MTAEELLAQVRAMVSQPGQPANAALGQVFFLILRCYIVELNTRAVGNYGLVVQHGPFAGMIYISESTGSVLAPKLLGSYEAELHPVLQEMRARPYETIVNLGCGEGYYAVGLARLMPAARVHAFDSDPVAQDLCRQLAALNGVADRVHVEGECTPDRLNELVRGRTLVFCDVEGAELTLLDPARAPRLAGCDVLVELHDFIDATISAQVAARFAGTHDLRRIEQGGRNPFVLPALRQWSQLDQALALCEFRPGPTPWAYLTARNEMNR